MLFCYLLVAIVMESGCGRKNEDFVPNKDVAIQALRTSLNAWKMGLPPGDVPNTKPLVYVTDTGRTAKQTLESFEILGETPSKSGRTFAVTLRLSNPTESIKTEYIVVGIDPLWVFRKEDFQLLMHWDHRMPDNNATETSSSK